MIEIDREIDGAYDFELGIERSSPLQYSITWPQAGEAPGVVLVIPGFGTDTNSEYSRGLRQHIVETTGMGAVSVSYHAIGARPHNGATYEITDRELQRIQGVAALNGLPLEKGMPVLAMALATAHVADGLTMRVTLQPTRDEYQNFGVMQALDHLAVIGDLIENAPAFDTRRIVVLGSSHGGYIGHLMAKFAPSTLAAVIDNSAYAQPPMSFLGIGDDVEIVVRMDKLAVHGSTRSAWSVSRREDPTFYDRDRDLIRDLRFLPHARTARAAASDAGAQYFMVISATDSVSPPQVKAQQRDVLQRAGFEAALQIVEQGDLDGRLFKTLGHGLDCSLKALFDREIVRVRPRETEPDATLGSVISYDCVDKGYRFTHTATAPYVSAETYDLHPVGG